MIYLSLFSFSFENNFTVCNILSHIITVKLIGKGWRFESRFQCLPVGGFGGMLPQKILKIRPLEMLFSVIFAI